MCEWRYHDSRSNPARSRDQPNRNLPTTNSDTVSDTNSDTNSDTDSDSGSGSGSRSHSNSDASGVRNKSEWNNLVARLRRLDDKCLQYLPRWNATSLYY